MPHGGAQARPATIIRPFEPDSQVGMDRVDVAPVAAIVCNCGLGGAAAGVIMLRSMHVRFAAVALIAAAAVSLSAAAAWAFSQQNQQTGGTDSSKFADPDDQFT